MPADAPPIPVMLVTGFLGAGKTTLIGRMLDHPAFAGSALLVNEVGEIGIDQDRLVDLVWGSGSPRTAHRTLQAYLSRLRGVLGPV